MANTHTILGIYLCKKVVTSSWDFFAKNFFLLHYYNCYCPDQPIWASFSGMAKADLMWWASGKTHLYSDLIQYVSYIILDVSDKSIIDFFLAQESRSAFEDMQQSFDKGAVRHRVIFSLLDVNLCFCLVCRGNLSLFQNLNI